MTLSGLVVSGAFALAATAVLALSSMVLPGPHRVEPRPRDGVAVQATSYTTSAPVEHELVEPGEAFGLAVRARGSEVRVAADGEGHLAVLLVAGSDDEALDTDGDGADEVLEVLAERTVDTTTELVVPRPMGSERVVAVICSRPPELGVGDGLAVEEDCVQREVTAPRERDS